MFKNKINLFAQTFFIIMVGVCISYFFNINIHTLLLSEHLLLKTFALLSLISIGFLPSIVILMSIDFLYKMKQVLHSSIEEGKEIKRQEEEKQLLEQNITKTTNKKKIII